MASNTTKPEGRTAFFYGTLMAPQVLHRVCHGSMSPTNPIYTQSNLATKPAILHNFRRHRVKWADYPAILPVSPTANSNDSTSSPSVRGTFVTSLTDNDIWRLDIFEGSEYERRKVRVRVLDVVGDDVSGEGNVEGAEVEAETYVWIAGEERLEGQEWDFGYVSHNLSPFSERHEMPKTGADVQQRIPARKDALLGRSRRRRRRC